MKSWIAWGMLTTLAVAGCGQAVTSGTAATGGKLAARAAEPFWPVAADSVWQYEVTAFRSDDAYTPYHGVETVTVDSVRRSGSKTVATLRAIDDFTSRYRFPTITQDGDKLVISDVTYWGPMARAAEGLTIDLLRFPLVTGKRWDDGGFAGTIKGKETVKVPAGTFEAYKVGAVGTHEQQYTAVGTYWVAPGVGIVKSELNVPGWDVESVMIPAGRQAPRR